MGKWEKQLEFISVIEEFVDEKFVLLENSEVYNAIIEFRESKSNVPTFSRNDIFNCAKDQ